MTLQAFDNFFNILTRSFYGYFFIFSPLIFYEFYRNRFSFFYI